MDLVQVKELQAKCYSLGFEGVEVLEKFTDKELQKICNGIGPEWMPDCYRKVADWVWKYLTATAFLHDAEYEAQIGFHKANSHFFTNGILEVKANFKWYNPRRYIGYRRVRQFYWLLETFGIRAYNEAVNKTQKTKRRMKKNDGSANK